MTQPLEPPVTEYAMREALRDAMQGLQVIINDTVEAAEQRQTNQITAVEKRLMVKIETNERHIDEVDKRSKAEVDRLERRLEDKVDALDKKMDTKLEDLDNKMDGLAASSSRVEGMLSQIQETWNQISHAQRQIEQRSQRNEAEITITQSALVALRHDIHGDDSKPEMTSVFGILKEVSAKTSDTLTMAADISRRLEIVEEKTAYWERFKAKATSTARKAKDTAVSVVFSKMGVVMALIVALIVAMIISPDDVELKQQLSELIKSILGG